MVGLGDRCLGQGASLFCCWWCHLLTDFGADSLPCVLFTYCGISGVPARSQHPCFTPLLPSFRLPCSVASIHALFRLTTRLASPYGSASCLRPGACYGGYLSPASKPDTSIFGNGAPFHSYMSTSAGSIFLTLAFLTIHSGPQRLRSPGCQGAQVSSPY